MSAADKIKNAAQDITGKAKETVGDVTNNNTLQAEGQADQAKAAVKTKGEDIKDVLK